MLCHAWAKAGAFPEICRSLYLQGYFYEMFIATDWVSSSWIGFAFFCCFLRILISHCFCCFFFLLFFLAFCFAVCLLYFTVFFQCFSFFGSPACSACSSAEFSHLYQWGQEHWQEHVKIMSRTCGNAFSYGNNPVAPLYIDAMYAQ